MLQENEKANNKLHHPERQGPMTRSMSGKGGNTEAKHKQDDSNVMVTLSKLELSNLLKETATQVSRNVLNDLKAAGLIKDIRHSAVNHSVRKQRKRSRRPNNNKAYPFGYCWKFLQGRTCDCDRSSLSAFKHECHKCGQNHAAITCNFNILANTEPC